MKYQKTVSFQKSYEALPVARQQRIQRALQKLAASLESGIIPAGLGLKRLRHDFWEIRAGLFDRVIFQRSGDAIIFVIVGTHDEIKRFLKKL